MDDEDDTKLLGVFRTAARAQRRVDQAREEPGFAAEPECFYVDPYELDVDQWVGGFVSVNDPDAR